jgi:hypothetical protein
MHTLYLLHDDGRPPMKVAPSVVDTLAKHGRVGVVLCIDGDPRTGAITKVADVGATRLTTERAVDALRRVLNLRRHRQRAGNTISAITAGSSAG